MLEPAGKRDCSLVVAGEDLAVGPFGVEVRLRRSIMPSCQGRGLMNFWRIRAQRDAAQSSGWLRRCRSPAVSMRVMPWAAKQAIASSRNAEQVTQGPCRRLEGQAHSAATLCTMSDRIWSGWRSTGAAPRPG